MRESSFADVQGYRGGSIEAHVDRGAAARWVELPVQTLGRNDVLVRSASAALAGAVIMILPVVLLRASKASAAFPFTFFYQALAILTITAIAGRGSLWLNRMALAAIVFMPAIVAHFFATFPRPRIAGPSSKNIALPYVLSLPVLFAAWLAMERQPILWPLVVYFLMAMTLSAWLILLLSCFFALRESREPIEIARARLMVVSAAFVPFLVVAASAITGGEELVNAALLVAFFVVVMPLPIGLAVSNYNLFDLGDHARLFVGRIVFVAAGALWLGGIWAVTLSLRDGEVIWSRHLMAVLSLSLVGVLVLEVTRGRFVGWMDDLLVPELERLRSLQAQYVGEIGELRRESEVASVLGSSLQRALKSRSGAVFLRRGKGWDPSFIFGADPPAGLSLVRRAVQELGAQCSVQLSRVRDSGLQDGALRELTESVELVAALRCRGELLGAVLLGPAVGVQGYASRDIDFLEVAATHAAMALHNARSADALLSAERCGVAGKTALAMAHEVSKSLGLMRTLAKRAAKGSSESRRVTRDVSMIGELSEELEVRMRRFVQDAAKAGPDDKGESLVGDAVDRAIRATTRIHGKGFISESIEPGVRPVRVSVNLERILVNLIDNALHASPTEDSVHVFATREDFAVRVSVFDHGSGMTDAERDKAFLMGFSTRQAKGGFGVGLAISRELAREAGGEVRLEQNPAGGTVATVRVPAIGG